MSYKTEMSKRNWPTRRLISGLFIFCLSTSALWAHGSSEAYLIVVTGLLAFIYFVHMAAGFAFAQITTRWLNFSKLEKLFIGFGWPAISMIADIPIVLYVELPQDTGLVVYILLSLIVLSILLVGIFLFRRLRE